MEKPRALSRQYLRLKKAIADELLSGAERVRRSYREEIVRTAWNIGKILRGSLGLEDAPSAGNAALVHRLSKDFERPDSFFYDAAKFHRLYPAKAPVALSWSHYALLIRLPDAKKRLALEKKALTGDINAKDLRIYTRLAPVQIPVAGNAGKLPLERGRLYHYRAASAPKNGRVRIDIGFDIQREVRYRATGSFHSGLIVRAVKEGEDYDAIISPFGKNRLYTYVAMLERVVDGDTLVARVDLGFRTWITQKFRLRGIDTPEVSCALGQKAKAEVQARLVPKDRIVIKTYKQEKYGRFLADIFYLAGASGETGGEQILKEGVFLNQELLDLWLAVPYDGEA